MKIVIINGPNLNLTGKREKEIYGEKSFDQFITDLKNGFPQIQLVYHQSNIEGELIDLLHQYGAEQTVKGILLNAGGFTHTSVAVADAVAAIERPVIEVHMSNIFAREDYRHVSYLGRHCIGSISGFGMESYLLGLLKLMNQA